jgi:hypothetical protein
MQKIQTIMSMAEDMTHHKLSNSQLSDADDRAVAIALNDNHTLTVPDLRGNKISDACATPLAMALQVSIHQGFEFKKTDILTLLDKMILLLDTLGMQESYYFVADAYFATGFIIKGLPSKGNHLLILLKLFGFMTLDSNLNYQSRLVFIISAHTRIGSG